MRGRGTTWFRGGEHGGVGRGAGVEGSSFTRVCRIDRDVCADARATVRNNSPRCLCFFAAWRQSSPVRSLSFWRVGVDDSVQRRRTRRYRTGGGVLNAPFLRGYAESIGMYAQMLVPRYATIRRGACASSLHGGILSRCVVSVLESLCCMVYPGARNPLRRQRGAPTAACSARLQLPARCLAQPGTRVAVPWRPGKRLDGAHHRVPGKVKLPVCKF